MLSVVIITKNEESRIEKCLKSVLFCDEIIVIDDYSKDSTVNIAKKYTKKIIKRKLSTDFSKQRNFGLSKAKNEWVLFIDADEVVPNSLKQEIAKTLKQKRNTINGYYIPRTDIFLGKKLRYGETGNIKLLRLARKSKGKWVRPVHEVMEVEGESQTLVYALLHYSHSSLAGFIKKINYYSTINARYLYDKKAVIHKIDLILYPSTKFILNFILKRGFLDGYYGYIFAIVMSMHSFLTRAKLYLLKHEKHK